MKPARALLLPLALAALGAAHAEPQPELSENEYVGEIRAIQSVAHLAQTPQDTPAAVTVLDRDFIRATGARTLADLFRFVPGFQVGYPVGGRPVVSYHGLSGQISQRVQVLVDGRSVYAPYLFGGVDWANVPVQVDDIDRIEVVRGGNSASYGANAFLGVIQVITRSAAQSTGLRVDVAQGSNGIRDRAFRIGRPVGDAQVRLSGMVRGDEGLENRQDTYRSRFIDLRADLPLGHSDELTLLAGIADNRIGVGFARQFTDPVREEATTSHYLSAQWHRQLAPGNAYSLTASLNHDEGRDAYTLDLIGGPLRVDLGRRARQATLSYSHRFDLGPELRAAWGADWRNESLWAPQLFNSQEAQGKQAYQAFGHLEWQPGLHWTFNAGGLFARDQLSGAQFAPRLFANWKPWPGQTLKAGVSEAFRTPSLFEQRADWQLSYQGQVLDVLYRTRGRLQPELVRAKEVVYLGEWAAHGLSLDVRVFEEDMRRLITRELYALGDRSGGGAYDLRNNAAAVTRGREAQLQWRPTPRVLVAAAGHRSRVRSDNAALSASVPQRSASLVASYLLPTDTQVGLNFSERSSLRWLGEATVSDVQRIRGASIAQKFRLEGTRAEAFLNWSAPVGRREEFREFQWLTPRWWARLTLEY